MFLALRDITHARGRFALITITVAMMALLTSFLSGLTGGLSHRNIAALDTIGGQTAYLTAAKKPSLDTSRIDPATTTTVLNQSSKATAISVRTGRIGDTDVAILETRAAAGGPASARTPLPQHGHIVLSAAAATLTGATPGDTVILNGIQMTVDAISGDDWFNHQSVIWGNLPDTEPATWIATSDPINEAPTTPTVLAVDATTLPSTMAAHQAENTSLGLINFMLLLISALVTGAFFTVWTVQRTPDIATLKALGATTSALVTDALGQALIILGAGISIGLVTTIGLGTVVGTSFPFVITPQTTVLPAVTMLILGLGGAGASLFLIKSASPLKALGANR